MSWMDSWSRPNKHAATPPPLYLTHGSSVSYCHSCGRVISGRKKTTGPTEVKYCSSRCRNSKPGPLDRKIETTFVKMLDGATAKTLMASEDNSDIVANDKDGKEGKKDQHGASGKKSKKAAKATKGDHRIILDCSEVEKVVFQRLKDPDKVFGRRKNRRARYVIERPEDWKSVDMVDKNESQKQEAHSPPSDDELSSESESSSGLELKAQQVISPVLDMVPFGYGSGKIRPPQSQNSINGSVGGEKGWAERIEETEEMKKKRREGQQRAEEREMVRKAARRGCAFGFVIEDGSEEKGEMPKRRMCEAVMKGQVVESSFAKGEWGIRWREKV
ncbi:hypothetical protein BKA64DRAFT_125460 [Cadophora sp. MPI-SDFR-AT-0126]|nr:hypothetical protein BKA64DRAFT_125460 [Leotiomycetes sp. MPI-SDFR-AT-0126]